MADNPGLHPPFLNSFEVLTNDNRIEFGVLTGDIVRNSTDESWDMVEKQLKKLNMEVYFCPGNHDVKPRELYEARYGKTYYAFIHKKNLFVVLDGSLDRWNIKNDQLELLKASLEEHQDEITNAFVFVHQLVWWDENNIFAQVNLNWPPYTPDTTNYWGEVEPLLQDYSRPVFIFAGDLGANRQASSLMYHRDRNIRYFASGMGRGDEDNFLLVHLANGEVEVEVFSIGDGNARAGELLDYELVRQK